MRPFGARGSIVGQGVAMRLAGWITGGTMAALLLAAPAGGQNLFDVEVDEIPYYHFEDDLTPATTSLGRSPLVELQNRFVASQVALLLPAGGWMRMTAIAPDKANPENDEPETRADFAVLLASGEREGTYRILGAELAVPSSWYQALFSARVAPLGSVWPGDSFGQAHARESRAISLQDYMDVRPDPARDDDRIQRLKRYIRERLERRRMERCEIPLEAPLANRATEIFRATLARARYAPPLDIPPKEATVIDPPYRFHFRDSEHEATARDFLQKGTRPELAVAAGMAMWDYCRTKAARHLETLRRTLDLLEERLPDSATFRLSSSRGKE